MLGLDRRHAAILATVGHQLRTPLTSIRGYLDSLLDDELDTATQRRFVETARREALRLGRLVDGILEFSLLDASARGRDSCCDVAEQIRVAVDAVAPLAREHRVTIAVRALRRVVARIDSDSCAHALLNMLDNSVKYCGSGGRVEIACEGDDRIVSVRIDDDGPGVASIERAHIFAFGTRGAGARGKGSGIGLAVVKAIAQRSGGTVCVGDSPLGGARFVLRIPAESEKVSAASGESSR
ncbi:MAG: HAMP domain-containing histidine kinase [Candidatus Eremiobacteraeota bacterium]|nr:HAMP domain-containing histidine kinase [Candidatus Eremiobacteraeota bacterium]